MTMNPFEQSTQQLLRFLTSHAEMCIRDRPGLLAGASTDQTAGGYISGASTPSAAVLPDDLHADQGKG